MFLRHPLPRWKVKLASSEVRENTVWSVFARHIYPGEGGIFMTAVGLNRPVEGGRYQVGQNSLLVVAIGHFDGRLAVVSRLNGGDRLSIWPVEHWVVEYAGGRLLGVDELLPASILRGSGNWLGIGCLVSQVDGELILSELEVFDDHE